MTKQEFTQNVLDVEKSMYHAAKAILGNEQDSADAVQTAILLAYKNLDSLKKPQFFKTWLMRILINECKAVLKKRRHTEYMDSIEEIADEKLSYTCESDSGVYTELDRLDEKYRIVFVLYYCDGFSAPEISSMLNLSVPAVKTRLCRARKILREKLEGELV